jgi:hypothetical protein
MNKRKGVNSNLNTITMLSHCPLVPQVPFTDLKSPVKLPPQHSDISTIPGAAAGAGSGVEADSCDSFNDNNLKYGKSQTLKESGFNRLRIHVYRKEKKSKWLDLL